MQNKEKFNYDILDKVANSGNGIPVTKGKIQSCGTSVFPVPQDLKKRACAKYPAQALFISKRNLIEIIMLLC